MGVRKSEQLRELLGVTLQIGNFINHGITDDHPDAGAVKGFAIESLHTLSTFKRGGISALHFLCVTLMKTFGNSFSGLLNQSLDGMDTAKRENLVTLQNEVKHFQDEIQFVVVFFKQLSEEDPEKERLMKLSVQLNDEATKLKSDLDSAVQVSNETLQYFSAAGPEKMGSFQDFCAHICQFLQQFKAAWNEIESGQGRYRKLLTGSTPKNSIEDATPKVFMPSKSVAPCNVTKRETQNEARHLPRLVSQKSTCPKKKCAFQTNVSWDAKAWQMVKKTQKLHTPRAPHSARTPRTPCTPRSARTPRSQRLTISPRSQALNEEGQFWTTLGRQMSQPSKYGKAKNCFKTLKHSSSNPDFFVVEQKAADGCNQKAANWGSASQGTCSPIKSEKSESPLKECEFHVLHSSSDDDNASSEDLSSSDSDGGQPSSSAEKWKPKPRRMDSIDTTCGGDSEVSELGESISRGQSTDCEN